jgi:hypothetical protein
MPFDKKSYTPPNFDDILQILIDKWNAEFKTHYTTDTFKGTNAYRFAYVFIQTQMQLQNEEATIYGKLKDYFNSVNAKMNAAITTNEGIVRAFKDKGYIANVRDNNKEQAGKLAIAVDVDINGEEYKTKKDEILNIIKDNSIAGLYTEGTQYGEISLSNNQSFTFRFTPVEKTAIKLELTIECEKEKKHNANEEAIKDKLLLNLKDRYGLGQDFVPAKYFEIFQDAPYAQSVSLKYCTVAATAGTDDSSSSSSSSPSSSTTPTSTSPSTPTPPSNVLVIKDLTPDIYKASFCDLFTFTKENITVTIHLTDGSINK